MINLTTNIWRMNIVRPLATGTYTYLSIHTFFSQPLIAVVEPTVVTRVCAAIGPLFRGPVHAMDVSTVVGHPFATASS
eukprot:COSAG01_NODE_65799_length_272_cov_0.601156_1_plen_77_part_01